MHGPERAHEEHESNDDMGRSQGSRPSSPECCEALSGPASGQIAREAEPVGALSGPASGQIVRHAEPPGMPVSQGVPTEAMTERQFEAVCGLIYDRLGLRFSLARLPYINKRVEMRMAALGLRRISEYLFHLRFLDSEGAEMRALANLVTTNETYMFREFDQLQAFADYCLPEVIFRRESHGIRRLRVWSAGCSSGEEPYTIAIAMREVMHDADQWDIRILATDIDEVRLRMARRAIYEAHAVRAVPDCYAQRHLLEEAPGVFRIHPDTAKLVKISYLNLCDAEAMMAQRDIDFVFCRNVLIYFDEASRRSVVDRFHGCLSPGGFLYLGHSESVSRISPAFRVRRMGPHVVHCK